MDGAKVAYTTLGKDKGGRGYGEGRGKKGAHKNTYNTIHKNIYS